MTDIEAAKSVSHLATPFYSRYGILSNFKLPFKLSPIWIKHRHL